MTFMEDFPYYEQVDELKKYINFHSQRQPMKYIQHILK